MGWPASSLAATACSRVPVPWYVMPRCTSAADSSGGQGKRSCCCAAPFGDACPAPPLVESVVRSGTTDSAVASKGELPARGGKQHHSAAGRRCQVRCRQSMRHAAADGAAAAAHLATTGPILWPAGGMPPGERPSQMPQTRSGRRSAETPEARSGRCRARATRAGCHRCCCDWASHAAAAAPPPPLGRSSEHGLREACAAHCIRGAYNSSV